MKQSVFAVLLLGFWSMACANLTMQVESSPVQLGQTFRLTLTLGDTGVSNRPDLRPLEQDFILVGTERRMNYSVINGQVESLNKWIILLRAKKAGVLRIPSIQVGHEQTPPSQIEVAGQALK